MTNQERAQRNIDRYQKEVRLVQLQNLAANALTRDEAYRHIAEHALINATLTY